MVTTARLTCTLSSGFHVGSYYVSWYQQKPGSPSRFLWYYYSDSISELGSGIPDRFSGSKSGSSGSLTITGLKAEDEANYYCTTWDKNLRGHTVLQACGEVRQEPTYSSVKKGTLTSSSSSA
ncbi:unnamed protein product [Gulo gulo]|uniref:Ig-like domain-containing protein n=1 Tax=Gulo gulo TaxID=48420 RepID=A0A9X9LK14_GULGU|nr:unnamed protein product [Gulo gulo]